MRPGGSGAGRRGETEASGDLIPAPTRLHGAADRVRQEQLGRMNGEEESDDEKGVSEEWRVESETA